MSVNDDIFKFEQMVVYQKSLEYLDFTYETSCKFPSNEIFMLTSQFIRTAQSISLNIAEGAGEAMLCSSDILTFQKVQ